MSENNSDFRNPFHTAPIPGRKVTFREWLSPKTMTLLKMKLIRDRSKRPSLSGQLSALGLLAILLTFTGCPPDTDLVPAFITMDAFELQTPSQGEPTSDIPEVWVFADAEFIGVFGLPARIPVPRAGSTQMRFEPGVRQNGVSAAPEPYDFYTPVNLTLDLAAGETISVGTLQITYKPEVRFSIFETFEPGEVRAFTEVITGMGTLAPSQEIVRTGDFSGKITLTADNPVFEVASAESFFDLNGTRRYVWLEMDFLSAAEGRIGVRGDTGLSSQSLFDPGFRPREQWTKIYFNITDIIVDLRLDPVQINLAAILPQGIEEGDVYLDNIKLIHF